MQPRRSSGSAATLAAEVGNCALILDACRRLRRIDLHPAYGIDTDATHSDLNLFFGLKGTLDSATNVDVDFDLKAPQIDAITDTKTKAALAQGLRFYALGTFDLIPGDDHKSHSKRLNLVHIENLNLTRWGGPNTSFRFTCADSNDKDKITAKILIEALDLPAKAMADPVATQGIEASKAKPYGLTRDSSVTDTQWEKVLRSLGRIQESMIMRIRDVTFESSDKPVSPKKESAMFVTNFKDGHWTRKIVLFQKMNAADDVDFSYTIAHEIGHAVDSAPAEGATGEIKKAQTHDLKKFTEAAAKDGGRGKAITKYAGTDDSEFFAENFALFIHQPDTLRTLRPNIYAFFVEYQWGALKDPKLNPYLATAGKNPQGFNSRPLF